MTTQSSLQYSFTFTQSHTHSYSASISSTLFLYGQFRGFSILPKDTSACRWGRLGIELSIIRLEGDRSTPQPQSPCGGASHTDAPPRKNHGETVLFSVCLTAALDSQINWLDLGGQRSGSWGPHKTCFWPLEEDMSFREFLKVVTRTDYECPTEGRQLDPNLPHLHAKVSFGKILNPELPLIEKKLLPIDALYDCVNGKKLYCRALWVIIKIRKALYKYRPFTIYISVLVCMSHSLSVCVCVCVFVYVCVCVCQCTKPQTNVAQ